MACSEEVGIGTYECVASSTFHGLPLLVEVGSCDTLAPAYHGAVGAALASAAVVETDEEVVVFSMLDDEGGFDCIFSCLDGVITLDGVVLDVVYLCKGDFFADATCDG